MLVLQLTSGALTLATSVNAGTANFGSPTNSLSVSGTTVLCTPLLQTTLTSPFVNVQATAGGSGCVIARAMMLILGAFQKNAAGAVKAGYHESVFSINAFASNAYPGGGFDYLLSF
jgi:cellobiose-specific phosphotransferase system component IIC